MRLADQHGYGKYSANHGKFTTDFVAVSTGYPLFSVLDMLVWLEDGGSRALAGRLRFEAAVDEPVTLSGSDLDEVRDMLSEEFKPYIAALSVSSGDGGARKRGAK